MTEAPNSLWNATRPPNSCSTCCADAGKKGSDLFITAGFPPAIKIDGKMTPVSAQVLTRPTRWTWRAPS
jgi:hypothetical protein